MKKGSIFSAVVMLIAFAACDQESVSDMNDNSEVELNGETAAAFDMASEETIELSFADVDLVAEEGMAMLDVAINSGAREEMPKGKRGRLLECAEVDRDTVNRVITIDFGDGDCAGVHGEVRKGKIIVSYDGERHAYGSSRTVTLEDFSIDSVSLEGTRKIQNLTNEGDTLKTIRTTMTGGKVTFADGTFATRDSDHTIVWYRGEQEGDNFSTLSGEASGTKRDGASYSVTILEDLTYRRSCITSKVVIPVSGVKEVINGDKTATFDYGDGSCDNEVAVTVDGVTTTETIRPRAKRMEKKS